ncbi:MAG: hypothetical protein KIT11_05010 [Fimbriimonadaceae bacterium]|nr:hypothetical protein [Fimbriimonadaceae bacterium]QYK56746.1 MAG: hypothetical protein KF733_04510 [Fimbriimonadaceae bacterium]
MPFASLALALALGSPQVWVSTARLDVVPPEPLPLGGYTERKGALFQPGPERLSARCVLLEQGSLRVAIVSLETLTIPEGLRDAVSRQVPDVRLFLTATHTHCAPDSQMLNPRMTMAVPGIATYRERWLEWYADRVAQCIREAECAQPRAVDTAEVRSARVALNRPRRDHARPSPLATQLTLMGARISHYAAHATLLGPEQLRLSGDWPGALADRSAGLVLVGAIGDVSPKVEGEDRPRTFARVFEEAVLAATPVKSKMGLGWSAAPIKLDPPKPHPEFAKEYGIPDAMAELLVQRFAPPAASVSLVAVGDTLLIGVPGEPSSALGRRLESVGKSRGFARTLVVSHANGWIGYVLEPSDYDRGGYEAHLSFNGRETSERVVVAVRSAASRLSGRPSPGRGWARGGS